jgi:hypothetical protein
MAYIGKRQTSTSYESDSEVKQAPIKDSRLMDEENRSNEGSSIRRKGSNSLNPLCDGGIPDFEADQGLDLGGRI